MAREQSDIYVIAPESAGEAAGVLRRAGEAARTGATVRVGVIESPYMNYGRAGVDVPRAGGGLPRHGRAGVDVPRAGEGLPPGFESDGGTILLSHERMRSVLEVSGPDLLAVVQGGVRCGELSAAAANEGLYFPHRTEIDMTVARMVMDGTIFPTEGGFGGLRESILSLELVTPAGETVRFGSRAIKDVGGYELIAFLLGRGGECGFISSATLRLLPEPGCRAFVAVTGEVRTLKAIAHNARRDFRFSSTVIYEAGAAGILAGLWRDALEGRGATLPPVLDPGGAALLIGGMQGLERVVEERLHALAGADSWGGTSFALLDDELFEISRGFLPAALDALGGAALHVSYDGAGGEPPKGALVYRSLYPERVNAVVRVPKGAAGAGPIGAMKADPSLGGFLSGLVGSLRRERVYILEQAAEGLRMTRVPDGELLGLAEGGGAGERRERVRALEALNEKIIRVFDPASIMMP